MVRRKIDNRIRVLIENGVTLRHRTMFAIVGEKARDQVSIQLNMCMYFEERLTHKIFSGGIIASYVV